MGSTISHMSSVYNRRDDYTQTVLELGELALAPLLTNGNSDTKFSHLVVSTTCPDTLAPSFGQQLNESFYPRFSSVQVIDMVQGCAGGVSALVLASQLTSIYKGSVAVVLADAARRSVADSNPLRNVLSNGAFACTIDHAEDTKSLLHYKTQQYKNLTDIVSVKLGHLTHQKLLVDQQSILDKPLDSLGLKMNSALAIRLLKQASRFYSDFISECGITPEVIIFHQVNPFLMKVLKAQFASPEIMFVDLSKTIGNCGAASFGVALDSVKTDIVGKKVFLCSFGTGGVITAALWQF